MNTKMKIHGIELTYEEWQEIILTTIDDLIAKERKRCTNCQHFDEFNEICNKYKQRPPARIIANGCVSFEDENEIPF